MAEHKTWKEEFKVNGEEVLSKIKELIKEGGQHAEQGKARQHHRNDRL